ncbi:MAG: PCYCGC motif-containing (lipo)protein [Ilumatobacteraceae bacterium]
MKDRLWFKIVAGEIALVAMIFLGVFGLVRGASGADPNDGFAASSVVTISLDTVPADMAAHYRYAAAHADEYTQIPCYCGCDNSLGHRYLTDCFVTPTGAWDAHAAGCAVCTLEATQVRAQIDTDVPIADIRASIIKTFGPPPTLTGTGAES